MLRLYPFSKTLVLLLLFLWSMGCATSPPTKFYLLSPLPAPEAETGRTPDQEPTVIRVDAVAIPGYLDRDEIVTRVSANEIHLADLNQWGEPLRDALTNLLALNLSRLLPKDFAFFPFKCPSPVDYQINVEIIRMDGSLDGEVHLVAQWSILAADDSDILIAAKSLLKSSKSPGDYGELVAAQSRLVEALSRDIAKGLEKSL